MKYITTLFLFFSFTMTPIQEKQESPILQITIDCGGVVWPLGKHNLLTIWRDGTVRYLVEAKREPTGQANDRINNETIEKVLTISNEISKLKIKNITGPAQIDYHIDINIKIPKSKDIEIINYDSNNFNKMPYEIQQLFCITEKIRNEPYLIQNSKICESLHH